MNKFVPIKIFWNPAPTIPSHSITIFVPRLLVKHQRAAAYRNTQKTRYTKHTTAFPEVRGLGAERNFKLLFFVAVYGMG